MEAKKVENEHLRGDIFYANLDTAIGSEQGGTRPVVIVQNDIGNKFANTVIIVPLTKKIDSLLDYKRSQGFTTNLGFLIKLYLVILVFLGRRRRFYNNKVSLQKGSFFLRYKPLRFFCRG